MENSNIFAFGFNDPNFSDVILRIRIIPDIDPSVQESNSSAGSEFFADSLLLASKSEKFKAMLTNRVEGRRHHPIELKLKPSDEAVFLDLLRYIYCMDLQRTKLVDFMALLRLADEFLVPSCMGYCCRMMSRMHMDSETALICYNLALQPSISESQFGHLIKDSAKSQLINYFRDVQRMRSQILKLPLIGLVVLLESELLVVESEDDLVRFVLDWGRQRPERKQDISRLLSLIRIPFLSLSMMNEMMTYDLSSDLCIRILSFIRHSFDPLVDNPVISQRCYRTPPIRVVQLGYPHYQTSVLLDLKWSFVKSLPMIGEKFTRCFFFNDQEFLLSLRCELEGRNHVLGFTLLKQSHGAIKFDCELSIRVAPTWKFKVIREGHCEFNGVEAYGNKVQYCCGVKDVAGVPWSSLVEEGGPYCCHGHLCLKVDLLLSR